MKVALVTGVAGGIGFATAQLLLKNGVAVVGMDVLPNMPKEMIGEFTYFQADLSNQDSRDHYIKTAMDRYGKIDILEVLVKTGITKSRGEGRRLVQQGGVSADDQKVSDIGLSFTADQLKAEPVIIKKGKKIFHKVQA